MLISTFRWECSGRHLASSETTHRYRSGSVKGLARWYSSCSTVFSQPWILIFPFFFYPTMCPVVSSTPPRPLISLALSRRLCYSCCLTDTAMQECIILIYIEALLADLDIIMPFDWLFASFGVMEVSNQFPVWVWIARVQATLWAYRRTYTYVHWRDVSLRRQMEKSALGCC